MQIRFDVVRRVRVVVVEIEVLDLDSGRELNRCPHGRTRTGEPNRVDRLGPTLPMRRGGEAVEVARAIVWLLSEEASYSTGTFIDVSGGR